MIDEHERFERAFELFPMPEPSFDRLLRRRDRKRRNQRITAGALGLVVCLFATVLFVRAFQSGPVPADEPKPSPSTERVGFVGLPPEGALPSTPAIGKLVLSLNTTDTEGFQMVDVYVYADGRVIWQKWIDVPEGANPSYSGYLEQRLTTEGVEILRSRILSTGLFEHSLRLVAAKNPAQIHIQVRKGDRWVFVEAVTRPYYAWWEADGTKETPAQARAVARLEALLADPAAWLPSAAWADPEIRPYVASRYSAVFDRRVPSPSELPSPADELLLDSCQVLTTEETRTISNALEDSGIAPVPISPSSDGGLAYWISGAFLHFHPYLPDETTCDVGD
jgi:hypothetical protein